MITDLEAEDAVAAFNIQHQHPKGEGQV